MKVKPVRLNWNGKYQCKIMGFFRPLLVMTKTYYFLALFTKRCRSH